MQTHLLGAFIATCFFVSLTPGLCSMLCMSLAIDIGVRRTQWMMVGELSGMASVAATAVLSVATVLALQPALLGFLRIAGSAYLLGVAWKTWQSAPQRDCVALPLAPSRLSLAGLGFSTAITNPKVWVLYAALLPPFVTTQRTLAPQLIAMLALIIAVELAALYLYAFGDRMLAQALDQAASRVYITRTIAVLMAAMGLWMLFQQENR